MGFQICCVAGGEEFCGGDDEEGVVHVCRRDACGCSFVTTLCCFGGSDFGLPRSQWKGEGIGVWGLMGCVDEWTWGLKVVDHV